MKNYCLVLLFGIFILSSPLSIAEKSTAEIKGDNAIFGIWLNAKKDGFIKIYKNNNNKFDGVIAGGTTPEGDNRVDINNPDPKLRSQLLLGKVILHGFIYEGENKWIDGQIYDPNNGKTYRCKLELIDHQNLSVRGYFGIPLFGRTEIWTRKQ